MTEPVTVLMPVGPNYNEEWFEEAVSSVRKQSYDIDELLIIADGHSIEVKQRFDLAHKFSRELGYGVEYTPFHGGPLYGIAYWESPANVGFTAAFNLGMGLAINELVMYLAADDKLMPTAIEEAVRTWEENDKQDAWYYLKYEDSNGHVSQIANNLAMTTKTFWKMVGGYPPAAFVGPDAALMSCLMVHAPDRMIPVESDKPLYWIRDHDQQETKIHTWKYVEEMNSIRGKLTAEFKLKDE